MKKKIQKNAQITKIQLNTDAQMKLVNLHSMKQLKAEDVFVFSLVLCDNDIDRDIEKFADSALDELAPLFVGKTGIFNHSWDAKDQIARIYRTELVQVKGKKNVLGEPLKLLMANAYILRIKKDSETIEQIEGGILKEVSVGVAMKGTACSICGSIMGSRVCVEGHEKGREYKGELCYGILKNAIDAYEFSFVAVPAQRAAGVTKSLDETKNAIDYILSADISNLPEIATSLLMHCQKALLPQEEKLKRQEIINENKKFIKLEKR